MLSVSAGVLGLAGIQVDGYPVVVRVLLRSGGGLDGRQLRGTNRTLRQTLVRVRVVLVALVCLLLLRQVVGADTQTVGHGCVRLNQAGGLTIRVVQTVLNDARNRHVVLRLSLKLHDGGDGQHLEGLLIAAHAGFLQVGLGLIDHGLNDLLDVGVLRESVLARVQPTLNRGEVARHAVLRVVLHGLFHLLAGERAVRTGNDQVDGLGHALTLRNRQVQHVTVRLDNRVDCARAAHVLLKLVGARLQVLAVAFLAVHLDELIGVGNHAGRLQLVRHLRGGLARADREGHGRAVTAAGVVARLERVVPRDESGRNNHQGRHEERHGAQHDGAATALASTQSRYRDNLVLQGNAGNAFFLIGFRRPKKVQTALFGVFLGMFILFGH